MSLIFGSDSCQHSEFQGFDELASHINAKSNKNCQILTKDMQSIKPSEVNGVTQGKYSPLIQQYCDADTMIEFGTPKQANLELLRIQSLICSKKSQYVLFTHNFESFNNLHMLFHLKQELLENLSSVILFEQILEKN